MIKCPLHTLFLHVTVKLAVARFLRIDQDAAGAGQIVAEVRLRVLLMKKITFVTVVSCSDANDKEKKIFFRALYWIDLLTHTLKLDLNASSL